MSPPRADIVEVILEGHLTEATLGETLANASAALRPNASHRLLFDCTTMTGYEVAARAAFVAWHKAHGGRVGRVAILTDKTLWHVVVSAMSLAAGKPMKAFSSREEGLAWLTSP